MNNVGQGLVSRSNGPVAVPEVPGVAQRIADIYEQVSGQNTRLKDILRGLTGEGEPHPPSSGGVPADTHSWLVQLSNVARENNILIDRINKAL